MAEPVRNEYIQASRNDPWFELGQSIMMQWCMGAILFADDDDHCNASEPIPLAERNRLRKLKIETICATERANEFLFHDPSLFKGADTAYISSEQFNLTYLRALALNHSDIQGLGIRQKQPLSDEALQCLKSFHRLRYLGLNCPIQSPALLPEVLPRDVEQLELARSWPLPELPKLNQLKIESCRIDDHFFDSLAAPHLQYLSLYGVFIPRGCFRTIGRFQNMKNVQIDDSYVERSDVESLRLLPYANSSIRTQSSGYGAAVREQPELQARD